jgi:hypothetical protein
VLTKQPIGLTVEARRLVGPFAEEQTGAQRRPGKLMLHVCRKYE